MRPDADTGPATAVGRWLVEEKLSLAAAARLFPPMRGERPVSAATVWRWIRSGVRLDGGHTVRLDAYRIGSRWATSREAVERFMNATLRRKR